MLGTADVIHLAIVIAPILCGIFTFRTIFKFLEWRDGDKDALWGFLSLCCGAGSSFFFFLAIIGLHTGPYAIIELGFQLGIILATAAIALIFVSTFLQWREAK